MFKFGFGKSEWTELQNDTVATIDIENMKLDTALTIKLNGKIHKKITPEFKEEMKREVLWARMKANA